MSKRLKRYLVSLIVTAIVSKIMYKIFDLDEESA